jgi:hypothetical protein
MLKKIKLDTPLGSVIDVYENPTEEELGKIEERFREVYPIDLIPKYVAPKRLFDDDGNVYCWMYGDATHQMVVPRLRADGMTLTRETKQDFTWTQIQY